MNEAPFVDDIPFTGYSRTEIEGLIPGGVKWGSNGEGQIHCPYHNDKNPSCSINVDKETFICHACGEKGKLSALLEHCGGSPRTGDNSQVAYDYRDAGGKLVYQSVRFYKNGKKEFFLRRPDGESGWITKGALKGIKPLLYNQPDINKTILDEDLIFVCEGEKDCDRLKSIGLIATCNHGGSKGWRTIHADYLRAANIVIVGDYDKPGQAYVKGVADSLIGKAETIRVADLGFPIVDDNGKDVSDWLDAHSKEEFLQLVENAKTPGEKTIELIPMEDVRTKDVPERVWFVENMLTHGLAVVAGKKAVGKSFFVLDMAFAIAAGHDFLGQKTTRTGVLYVPTELDEIAVHERLQKYTMMPPKLYVHYNWTQDEEALKDAESILKRGDIRIIVFDMFLPIIPEAETNQYESSALFLSWRKLAQKYQAAIVAVWHAGKTTRKDWLDAIIGTTGFVGQSDSVILLERPNRTEPDGTLRIAGNHGKDESISMIFDNCTWHRRGGIDENYVSPGDQELIKIVEAEGPISATDVAAKAERSYDKIRQILADLHAREQIDRDGARGPYIPIDRTQPNLDIVENEEC